MTLGIWLPLAFLAAATSVACSGVPCDQPHCQKDPLPVQQMIDTCNNAHSNKCSGAYDNWQGCILDKTACDPVNETTDPISRQAAIMACQPKYQAYLACAGTL